MIDDAERAKRADVERAAEKVERRLQAMSEASALLWSSPRDAARRRMQSMAFAELSQAQFELEQALTHVNPVPVLPFVPT